VTFTPSIYWRPGIY